MKEMNKMEFLHAQLEGYYNEKYSFYITIEREQMECYMYDCDGGDIDENSRGILSKLNEEIAVEIEEDLQIDLEDYGVEKITSEVIEFDRGEDNV